MCGCGLATRVRVAAHGKARERGYQQDEGDDNVVHKIDGLLMELIGLWLEWRYGSTSSPTEVSKCLKTRDCSLNFFFQGFVTRCIQLCFFAIVLAFM